MMPGISRWGMVFDNSGRMYVWEKAGRVWIVEGGVKSAQPLIDISEEVGDWESHGLKGFALDPDFENNGFIYLLYAVDKHHLIHFGYPTYDPLADQFWENTIGRLTRYTANASDGFHSVDPASRFILIGQTVSRGIPICGIHGVGTVLFFHDGSLMVSTGDGNEDGYGTSSCVADGITKPKEEVNSRRSQLLDSLSGKIPPNQPGHWTCAQRQPLVRLARPGFGTFARLGAWLAQSLPRLPSPTARGGSGP